MEKAYAMDAADAMLKILLTTRCDLFAGLSRDGAERGAQVAEFCVKFTAHYSEYLQKRQ